MHMYVCMLGYQFRTLSINRVWLQILIVVSYTLKKETLPVHAQDKFSRSVQLISNTQAKLDSASRAPLFSHI